MFVPQTIFDEAMVCVCVCVCLFVLFVCVFVILVVGMFMCSFTACSLVCVMCDV